MSSVAHASMEAYVEIFMFCNDKVEVRIYVRSSVSTLYLTFDIILIYGCLSMTIH